jgi:hypothetical protein
LTSTTIVATSVASVGSGVEGPEQAAGVVVVVTLVVVVAPVVVDVVVVGAGRVVVGAAVVVTTVVSTSEVDVEVAVVGAPGVVLPTEVGGPPSVVVDAIPVVAANVVVASPVSTAPPHPPSIAMATNPVASLTAFTPPAYGNLALGLYLIRAARSSDTMQELLVGGRGTDVDLG